MLSACFILLCPEEMVADRTAGARSSDSCGSLHHGRSGALHGFLFDEQRRGFSAAVDVWRPVVSDRVWNVGELSFFE